MTKVTFTHDGERWWFDPESGEYEYEGSNHLIRVLLENLKRFERIQTGDLHGIDAHPGERWESLSPEERKRKVLNYLTRVNGIEIHDKRETRRN